MGGGDVLKQRSHGLIIQPGPRSSLLSLQLLPEAYCFRLGATLRLAVGGGDSGNEPSDDRAPISRPRPTARITTRCLPEHFFRRRPPRFRQTPSRQTPALRALMMEHNEAGLSVVQDFRIAILILSAPDRKAMHRQGKNHSLPFPPPRASGQRWSRMRAPMKVRIRPH